MKFGSLAKMTRPELIISLRHESWQAENGNPAYTEEALDFARQALADQARPRDRRGTFSASSSGSCRRRQMFTYLGMPELPYDSKTNSIFVTGTFMHIRWQMAGLTAGWLSEAEVPLPQNPYQLSGTMDGLLYDGSVAEFKSCNGHTFMQVATYGPKFQHLFQGATYALATGREKISFLYEHKDTSEYKEIVKHRDELPLGEVADTVRDLWRQAESKQLPHPIDQVYEGKYPCSTCPFRKVCLEVQTWEQAEEIAEGKSDVVRN